MEKKRQIVFIHGGDACRDPESLYQILRERSFDPRGEKKRWRDAIKVQLSETHDCFIPKMPNVHWADYTAWKIWFEKLVPFLHDDVILVGYSLGSGFILRYLSEEVLPVTVTQLHLVAPVIEAGLPDTDGFTTDLTTWSGFASTILAVHLWHSSDDPYVPIAHSENFAAVCQDGSLHRFDDRGHFFQPEFPELLAKIQNE